MLDGKARDHGGTASQLATMTRGELAALFEAVKRTQGACLPRGVALQQFLDEHAGVGKEEARAASLAFDRCPFPSVDGNPPRFRDRPYYDARFWDRQATT